MKKGGKEVSGKAHTQTHTTFMLASTGGVKRGKELFGRKREGRKGALERTPTEEEEES